MYLFNAGLTCVKGIHHPTVAALQLGQGRLHNEAVGSVWHHAHEWVRHNLPSITDKLKKAERPFDVRLELGLTDECYSQPVAKTVDKGMWKQHFGNLGVMSHAFPRVQFQPQDVSFARDMQDRNFFRGVTDGDQSMFDGVADGMGGYTARDNRGRAKVRNDACAYHKGERIKQMIIGFLDTTKALRKASPKAWDKKFPLGHRFGWHGSTFQKEFGSLLDDVMQHDSRAVAGETWSFIHHKCRLMGVPQSELDRLDRVHHPVTGEKGKHGRSTQTHEAAVGTTVDDHPLNTLVDGVVHGIVKGVVSSANSLEARINKRLKRKVRHAQLMRMLLPLLLFEASKVSCECAGRWQYSAFVDYFGQCPSTTSTKKTGRLGKEPTSRNHRQQFLEAIMVAQAHRAGTPNTDATAQYHRESAPNGLGYEYTVASKLTLETARKMVDQNAALGVKQQKKNLLTVTKAVAVLRDCWVAYKSDPHGYIQDLYAEVPTWTVARARTHIMQPHAFGKKCKHGEWHGAPTPSHVAVIVESEIRFNNQAFQRVVPCVHLSRDEALPHLGESWRTLDQDDPWLTDIGFFECLHCNQYSKTKYCVHVAAVTLIEEVLEGVPGCMVQAGVGSIFGVAGSPECKDRHAQTVTVESPYNTVYSCQVQQRRQIDAEKRRTQRRAETQLG